MLKRKSGKLLILIIISMLMFNFIGSNVVMAENKVKNTVESNMNKIVEDPSGLNAEMEAAGKLDLSKVGGVLLDGLAGILTYFERFKVIIIGGVCQFLATVVGDSAGSEGDIVMISPEDILFNKLAITDINFFNMTTFGSNNTALSNDNPIKMLKQSVATWYMTLRTIAIIILLAVLIYIGIRMAMTSVASEKAEYKKMLMNWVVSLALVFLLHYIIIFALNINNAFIQILASVKTGALATDNTFWTSYLSEMLIKSFSITFTLGWSSAILYVCVVALTFIFLIMYIKRMITIAFLILISPVITITYSIDKLGDGRAQAFQAWMKEFLHNVFIQPFHCLIYLAFTSIAMQLLRHSGTLAATVLVILTMIFILEAEKLIKKIFGIDSESTGSGLATAMVLSSAYGKLNFKKDSSNAPTNGKAKASSVGSKPNTQTSMTANNNMAAVTPTGTNTDDTQRTITNAPIRTNSQMNSEQLSAALSGGSAHAKDYDATMGYDDQKTSRGLNKEQDLARAQAEDYNSLMGYGDTTEKPQINRVYGIKGNLQTEDSKPNEVKRNQVYGVPGTHQPEIPKQQPKTADTSSFAKSAWNLIKKGNKMSEGMAGAVIGGTLAGIGGANIAETIGSVSLGKKMQENAETKMKNYLSDIKIRNQERNLASDFRDYKGGSKYDSERDRQKTLDYLNMDKEQVSNINNKSERHYVQSLHALRDEYLDRYDDENPNDRVLDTIDKIGNGVIPPIDKETN